MKFKNILVTGASGLLGRSIMKNLKAEKSWKLTGTAHTRKTGNLIKVDLCDLENIPAFLHGIKPDVIIHAAAERRPDVSMKDPQGTQLLNVDATAAIAEWAAENNVYLIYISSDYVFDGTQPPYNEDSPPGPINDYGRSKRAGEVAVLSKCSNAAILRVPVLYGDVEYLDESSVLSLAKQMLELPENEYLTVENWAVRHPTLTDDVADILRQILIHAHEKEILKGIFHWSSDEAMTKYDMACVIAGFINFSRERLTADDNPPAGAPRPKDCTLDTSLLRSRGIEKQTPFRDAIQKILHKFLNC
ncbi:MAG: SDR family oxidoreductase [Kiritimatiellia bacterium]